MEDEFPPPDYDASNANSSVETKMQRSK